jgi:voltage-gated potassium channel
LAVALVAAIFAGAYLVWCSERATNEPFSSYGATLWWAAITASTIGYGDMAPRTAEGRAVALVFIFLAVGLFGVVSATIAGYLVSHEQEDEQEAVMSYLHQITETLSKVEERLSAIEGHMTRADSDT